MRNAIRFLALSAYYFFSHRRARLEDRTKATIRDASVEPWLEALSKNGYAVIPRYKSAEWCAEARGALSTIFSLPDVVTRTGEDTRIFGVESLSPHAAEFAHDPLLSQIARVHAERCEELLFCMANRLSYRTGAYGSGGEWHRDSFKRELKAMLYLTDVSPNDGPFSLVERSHHPWQMLKDTLRFGWRILRGTHLTPTRLRDAGERLQMRRRILTGSAGTLLLFDASAIHTGLPPLPQGSERMALTNYYVTKSAKAAHLNYYRQHVVLNG